jgi:hypothetical protein
VTALPRRAAAWLAGVWCGLVGALGFIAAPLLFATLPRGDAGRVAARLFAFDAALGLALGGVLLVLALQEGKRNLVAGGSRFSAEMVLALTALFCIVAGHYAIEPMLAAAGRGEGPSFAVLHGVASVFFAAKFVAVGVLAWRLGGAPRRAGDATTAPSS